jgi:non-ribosomal peptide synthetase component F
LAKINQSLKLNVNLETILQAPSMIALATSLSKANPSDHQPLKALSSDAPLRMAPLQARLWFLCQLEQERAAYNMPYALRLKGNLDVPALSLALQELTKQHSVLRSRFNDSEGFYFELHPPAPVLEVTSKAEPIEHLVSAEAQRPFDIAEDSLLRATLVPIGEQDHIFMLTLHHLVFDGWSLGLLIRDLSENYRDALAGKPLRPAAPLQYKDYAAWEWQRQSERLETERQYWRKQLQDVPPPLALPFDRKADNATAGQLCIALQPEWVTAIENAAQNAKVTPFMWLQTTFSVALAQWCGVDDLVLGTPASSRPHPATENMIGMFVNTLPLRHRFPAQTTFADLLQGSRQTTLDAFSHNALSFDQIVDVLSLPRTTDRPALFQVLFALQNLAMPQIELQGLDCEVVSTAPPQAKLDLSLYIEPGSEWFAQFEFRADRFDSTTVEAFANHWLKFVDSLVEQPEKQLNFTAQTKAAIQPKQPQATSTAAADHALLAQVRNVFSEVLPATNSELRDDSDFFEHGGNSLLAARVVARLRKRLGLVLPLKAMFDHPTANRLSHFLETKQQDQQDSLPNLPKGNRQSPLSLTQNGMWVMHQTEGHTGNFNMPRATFLEGNLNVAALKSSFEDVQIRQPLLRCRLEERDSQPTWVYDETLSPQFTYRQIKDETKALRIAEAFAVEPFDLSQSQPVRYLLIEITPQRFLFMVVLHHIAGDEWSLQILFDQLLAHYHQPLTTRKLPHHSYLDFAIWQHQWLKGKTLNQHLQFFVRSLQTTPASLSLPTDFPRPAQQEFAAAQLEDCLDGTTLETLRDFAKQEQATLYQICFAAFALLLSKHAQQERLAIATPAANRPIEALETMVGCFANTLIAAVELPVEATWIEAFRVLRQHLFDLQRYQALPFEMLVRHINPPRDDSRHPIAQVGFALQNVPREKLKLQDVSLKPVAFGNLQARFDIELYLHEANNELVIHWIYKTGLFSAETIASFNQQWQHLLTEIIANPTQPVVAIPLAAAPAEADSHEGVLDVDSLSEDDLDALLGDLMDEDG